MSIKSARLSGGFHPGEAIHSSYVAMYPVEKLTWLHICSYVCICRITPANYGFIIRWQLILATCVAAIHYKGYSYTLMAALRYNYSCIMIQYYSRAMIQYCTMIQYYSHTMIQLQMYYSHTMIQLQPYYVSYYGCTTTIYLYYGATAAMIQHNCATLL